VGLVIPLYYALEWRPLRLAVSEGARGLLALLGHQAVSLERGGGLYLALTQSGAYEISANCTYADLVLVLAPFVWRFDASLGRNLGRLAAVAAAVFSVNLARVALALHFHELGAPWRLAHAVPDVALHALAIAGAVVLAVAADLAAGSARGRSRAVAVQIVRLDGAGLPRQ